MVRGLILSIEKTGVRITVLSIVGDWAQVICPAVRPNPKSGWLGSSIQNSHPDEISLDTPLGQILHRHDWAKDMPGDINPTDLCMLVDSGFILFLMLPEWQYNDGQIIL